MTRPIPVQVALASNRDFAAEPPKSARLLTVAGGAALAVRTGMRTGELARFLDAQADDTVAVWIVLQLLIRRLCGDRPEDGSDGDRDAMLRTAITARLRIARTDVWN